jgi:hypothetical protein
MRRRTKTIRPHTRMRLPLPLVFRSIQSCQTWRSTSGLTSLTAMHAVEGNTTAEAYDDETGRHFTLKPERKPAATGELPATAPVPQSAFAPLPSPATEYGRYSFPAMQAPTTPPAGSMRSGWPGLGGLGLGGLGEPPAGPAQRRSDLLPSGAQLRAILSSPPLGPVMSPKQDRLGRPRDLPAGVMSRMGAAGSRAPVGGLMASRFDPEPSAAFNYGLSPSVRMGPMPDMPTSFDQRYGLPDLGTAALHHAVGVVCGRSFTRFPQFAGVGVASVRGRPSQRR